MAFGLYVHVPFCARRCGYCAFVTYAPGELTAAQTHDRWADAAVAEVGVAAREMECGDGSGRPIVDTVYFGGGTPTAVDPDLLARVIGAVRKAFPMADDVEISVEANPDGLAPGTLEALAGLGVGRVSFGMQSAIPRVLTLLDRTHDPESVPAAVDSARAAGIPSVSLDLIAGTPGESDADWAETVAAALSLRPDHLSAYSLGIEAGTRLAARVRRGELAEPSPDEAAARYEHLDAAAGAAGLSWYEVSNWARTAADRCRHNLGYWRSDDWWGIGPGAHSHVAGRRWWNHSGLDRWSDEALAGRIPAAGSEEPTEDERLTERIMLGVRLAEGLATDEVVAGSVASLVDDGLVDLLPGSPERIALTPAGRLLADLVVRRLRWG